MEEGQPRAIALPDPAPEHCSSRAEKPSAWSARGPAERMAIRCPRIQDGKIMWALQIWDCQGSSLDLPNPGNNRKPAGLASCKNRHGEGALFPLASSETPYPPQSP